MSRRKSIFLSRKSTTIAPSLVYSHSDCSSISSISAVYGSACVLDDEEKEEYLNKDMDKWYEEAEDRWSRLLPELLREIIIRVEKREEKWPMRKDVVACACVCKRWRDVTFDIVKSVGECGKITFPSSLKQVGFRFLFGNLVFFFFLIYVRFRDLLSNFSLFY